MGWNKTRQMQPLLNTIRVAGVLDHYDFLAGSHLSEVTMREEIVHHDTIHLRLGDAEQLILGMSGSHFRDDLEDITPPFARVWAEMTLAQKRIGILVERLDAPTGPDQSWASDLIRESQQWGDGPHRHLVIFWLILGVGNCGQVIGRLCTLTDLYGQIAQIHGAQSDELNTDGGLQITQLCCMPVWEAMVRMNTRGTRLEPIADDTGSNPIRRRHKPLEATACVWQRIVIPEFKGEDGPRTQGVFIAQESEDRRERWISACRKDYRKGSGLFGKYRQLVWVPEHLVGNPEKGKVIPEFELKGDNS